MQEQKKGKSLSREADIVREHSDEGEDDKDRKLENRLSGLLHWRKESAKEDRNENIKKHAKELFLNEEPSQISDLHQTISMLKKSEAWFEQDSKPQPHLVRC